MEQPEGTHTTLWSPTVLKFLLTKLLLDAPLTCPFYSKKGLMNREKGMI